MLTLFGHVLPVSVVHKFATAPFVVTAAGYLRDRVTGLGANVFSKTSYAGLALLT